MASETVNTVPDATLTVSVKDVVLQQWLLSHITYNFMLTTLNNVIYYKSNN